MKYLILILSALTLLTTACDKTSQYLDCVDGCSQLRNGADGRDGRDGIDGAQGPVGPQGTPGVSCSVEAVSGGSLIACTDGTSSLVSNGTNGTNGTDGQDGSDAVIETIELCPTLPGGVFKEYVLRIGNALIAVYYTGSQAGLAKLSPGNWVTTDGRNCRFSVSVTNEISY